MFTLMCFLFSVLSLAIMNDAFDVGFTSETPDVNTYDKMPPRARQILYSEGTPDIIPINEEGSVVTLPISTNPYGQWVIVNAATAKILNFGGNPKRNVLINNAISRVDVEYDPVRSIGNPIKVFDNSGTLHLKKPNDYSELATTEP